MNRFDSRLLSGACAIACLFACSSSVEAAARPHLSRGNAQFVSGSDFVGSGSATHLGRYSETGSVSFSPTGDAAVLHVEGSAIYTASDGAELHADIDGELNTETGVISATLTYVGGTGRLTDASGTASLAGQLSPGGAISVSVSGSIDY